ncbi:MAG TPA: DUF5700 domain-containing putative Zn-dependent protease [Thermoanaerobaculia bacterium]|nr:DUF5700 domain-containing putative Zn-dependent protease [Thermoanaerobaculia bacterium]
MFAALLLSVTLVSDQPEAVLAILEKRAGSQAITEVDWQRLFTAEGYVRLKKREQSMQRPFEDEAFRTFVLSDDLLAKRPMLSRVLNDWKRADLSRATSLAQAYLPPGTKIEAKIYPSIKPATNSFVFELDTDPAIFKYIEDEPRERFEQVIAHEMHHVGYRRACRGNDEDDLLRWLGAFGEGFAVLAAAGGPDADPQQHSPAGVQAEWKRQMADLEKNFHEVETFLADVAAGLPEEEQHRRGFAFYGVQGPWYSVGWKMAVVIEKTLGRETLVAVMCDRSKLFAAYNRASDAWFESTGERLPKWRAPLISRPPR